MSATGEQAAQLQREWETDPRWAGITRDYSARDVIRLRGRVAGEHSLARRGASRLWDLLRRPDAVVGPELAPRAVVGARPHDRLGPRPARAVQLALHEDVHPLARHLGRDTKYRHHRALGHRIGPNDRDPAAERPGRAPELARADPEGPQRRPLGIREQSTQPQGSGAGEQRLGRSELLLV